MNIMAAWAASYDKAVPEDLVYSGNYKVTDEVSGAPLNMGKLVLSPTRTYAPVMIEILKNLRSEIHGVVHCSGGAQTKVLHFIENLHVIKDNLFDIPPLFKFIHGASGTDLKEMYKVFNMGHRMEIYLPEAHAQQIIDISKSFGIDAQIVGRVETASAKQFTLKTQQGEFIYN
jgi:phosphoribosylformylglycinamidine cyclo-ligase